MQYGVFYMHKCEQSGVQSRTHSPAHQTAHTDTRKTYHSVYAAVSLRMSPRGSKHVGDIRNYILIYKTVHCIGLCCIVLFIYSTFSPSAVRYLGNYSVYFVFINFKLSMLSLFTFT